MSGGTVPFPIAAGVADAAVRAFRAVGLEAEPVGSVRRRRPLVGDVEVLVTGGEPLKIASALTVVGAVRAPPNRLGRRSPFGPRYYRTVVPNGNGDVQLDVFVCLPPAEYGVLRLIRTGSADFSQAVVTRLHRYGLESRDGRVVDRETGDVRPTPTEEGVLRLARLPWVPPSEREMDHAHTAAAFRREAAPWECRDPATACATCGMVHAGGMCP